MPLSYHYWLSTIAPIRKRFELFSETCVTAAFLYRLFEPLFFVPVFCTAFFIPFLTTFVLLFFF
jgi:hypothetical protein